MLLKCPRDLTNCHFNELSRTYVHCTGVQRPERSRRVGKRFEEKAGVERSSRRQVVTRGWDKASRQQHRAERSELEPGSRDPCHIAQSSVGAQRHLRRCAESSWEGTRQQRSQRLRLSAKGSTPACRFNAPSCPHCSNQYRQVVGWVRSHTGVR